VPGPVTTRAGDGTHLMKEDRTAQQDLTAVTAGVALAHIPQEAEHCCGASIADNKTEMFLSFEVRQQVCP